MTPTIDLMQQHTSVRHFKEEVLAPEVKQQLLNAAYSGSSSNFVQATSIIEITDEKIRHQLADSTQSAPYVKKSGAFYVFVADLYRQAAILEKAKQPLAPIENMEALLVSVVDTTIAAENMALAAESLDLGVCFIGGIRNNLELVKELLHLPKYTIPLFGLTIGIPEEKNEPKPRLPQKNTVFTNTYNELASKNLIDYDELTAHYYQNRQTSSQNTNWSQKMLAFFAEPQRGDVAKFLKEQGFSLN